jgi:hypothetical protein
MGMKVPRRTLARVSVMNNALRLAALAAALLMAMTEIGTVTLAYL